MHSRISNFQRVIASVALLAWITLANQPALAGEYTPPGLYEIEYYQLPNQMQVVLKERHQARSVSFRVVVNVGMADFPCGRKETPHFLEHLLFTGTSTHGESELDDLVAQRGGWWNAHTYQESTTYELDIFSKYADFGLEILHEILTDSSISPEDIDTSRDIVHRESGGRPSAFKKIFSSMGLGVSAFEQAHDRLLQGTPYVCESFETADDITRDDIMAAYKHYYVPNNITLIVVGDFDSAQMKTNIESSFGAMEIGQSHRREAVSAEANPEALLLSSTLFPLIDNEALAGLAFVSGGSLSTDFYPRWFIEEYLTDRLFEVLRVEQGLSYGPTVDTDSYPNTDVWYAYADTELSDVDRVVKLIQQEIDQLVSEPIDPEKLEMVKNELLLLIVQGYESNAGIADYYQNSLHELQRYGALIREEEEIHALTAAEIQRVAGTIFKTAAPVIIHHKPTITYTQLGIALGICIVLIGYLVLRRLWRLFGRTPRAQPS